MPTHPEALPVGELKPTQLRKSLEQKILGIWENSWVLLLRVCSLLGLLNSVTPNTSMGPPHQDGQRGSFPALQLTALLLARQSVPLSPAHAGRMKEN